MHVGYSLGMPGGRIDREAWAHELTDLIARFDPGPRGDGNKSAFSRRIGLTTRTIDRWLSCQVDVSSDSVRAVAEALCLPARERAELLAKIGFFITTMPAAPDPREDPIIREILDDPSWTEEERALLVARQLERIEADLRRRREEYEWMVQQQKRRDAS